MKSEINNLTRDVQIHKEVEKELAKRSHFCQKVIKRLKQQVKDLEADKGGKSFDYGGKPAVMGMMGGSARNKYGSSMDAS